MEQDANTLLSAGRDLQADMDGPEPKPGPPRVEDGHAPPAVAELTDAAEDASANDSTASAGDEPDSEE